MEIAVTLSQGAANSATKTIDISKKGLLAATAGVGFCTGRAVLDVEGLGKTPVSIVAISYLGIHCAFANPPDEFSSSLTEFIAHMEEDNHGLIELALSLAGEIAAAFAAALDRNALSEEVLFDVDYAPIAGTEPAQFDLKSLVFLEQTLAPIFARAILSDRAPDYCCAVDRNGYLPVHNVKYSQPQRPGDVAWNTRYARNKRIFNDRTGMTAARNIRRYHIQNYARDMGNGDIVLMKEINCPIKVRGRHWGGIRLAFFI